MDFLELLLNRYGFDYQGVIRFDSGQRYSGLMLKNGSIGVCANFGISVSFSLSPSLSVLSDRIFLTAYFNAIFNSREGLFSGDLLKIINFEKYKNIVMIGFFKPIYEKLKQIGKDPIFFDYKDIENKTPEEQKSYYLDKADVVIISSTTVFNNTLYELIESSPNAKHYLLGPSAIFNELFFEYNIDGIFGTQFRKNDFRVLDIIANDGGTRDFQKFGYKKALINVGIQT